MKRIKTDPNSDLDYSVDWTNWLETDESVHTSTWVVTEADDETKITLHDAGITSNVTFTFASFTGAEEGEEYIITNRIITDSVVPRTEDSSIKLIMVEK